MTGAALGTVEGRPADQYLGREHVVTPAVPFWGLTPTGHQAAVLPLVASPACLSKELT